jgi:hypothetical protein
MDNKLTYNIYITMIDEAANEYNDFVRNLNNEQIKKLDSLIEKMEQLKVAKITRGL